MLRHEVQISNETKKIVLNDRVSVTVRPFDVLEDIVVKQGLVNLASGSAAPFTVYEVRQACVAYAVERVVDWAGFLDEKGEPLPCTERTRLDLFRGFPDWAVTVVGQMFHATIRVEDSAKKKQSSGVLPETATTATM